MHLGEKRDDLRVDTGLGENLVRSHGMCSGNRYPPEAGRGRRCRVRGRRRGPALRLRGPGEEGRAFDVDRDDTGCGGRRACAAHLAAGRRPTGPPGGAPPPLARRPRCRRQRRGPRRRPAPIGAAAPRSPSLAVPLPRPGPAWSPGRFRGGPCCARGRERTAFSRRAPVPGGSAASESPGCEPASFLLRRLMTSMMRSRRSAANKIGMRAGA